MSRAIIFSTLISVALLSTVSTSVTAAQTENVLDELLAKVRKEQAEESRIHKERESKFLKAKNRQAQLLNQAKAQLREEQKRSELLKKQYDTQEKQLAKLEQNLILSMGSLGELFGVVRQVAGDTAGQFENSLVSTQDHSRIAFLKDLAQRKALPSIDELQKLWFLLQQEMTESGKVVKFPGKIIRANGVEDDALITRIGVFNAVSDGKFLRYASETNQLIELPRQPASRYQNMAQDLETSVSGMTAMAIDPSRGAILSMLVRSPGLMERIQQGKLIGYVIIALAIIGLLIVAERLYKLTIVERGINRQRKSDSPNPDNPLGRIIEVYTKHKTENTDVLERKIDEAILKETPTLEKRLAIIKILAAIAPLLGLLGTVTGMIATFQSITLFGAGDPKLMAGGISQALMTTVLGLTAAIPLILLHSVVASKSKRCVNILEEQSAGFIARHAEKEA